MVDYWLDTEEGMAHKGYPNSETDCGETVGEDWARASTNAMLAHTQCPDCFSEELDAQAQAPDTETEEASDQDVEEALADIGEGEGVHDGAADQSQSDHGQGN